MAWPLVHARIILLFPISSFDKLTASKLSATLIYTHIFLLTRSMDIDRQARESVPFIGTGEQTPIELVT
jgi:hypothetical protein